MCVSMNDLFVDLLYGVYCEGMKYQEPFLALLSKECRL